MLKKVFIILLFISSCNLYGLEQNTRLALHLQQAKKIDKIVQRTNILYDFVNLFIMETGRAERLSNSDASINANMAELNSQYGAGIRREGFLRSLRIDFKVNVREVEINGISIFLPTTVTFYNLVPNNLPNFVKQTYINNTNFYPSAVVDPITLNVTYMLRPETIGFINRSASIAQLVSDPSTVSIGIDTTVPECNDAIEVGNVWYKPDGMGEFLIDICTVTVTGGISRFSFETTSNRLDIGIFRELRNQLTSVRPLIGTIGYYLDATNPTLVHKMIYTGIHDGRTVNGWAQVEYD